MAKNRSASKKHLDVVRVVLVDDHPMVRERLTEVIQSNADFLVCGEAEGRFEALDVIATARPDLVVLDLTLKNSNGIDLIKDVRARWPELKMLVVSMHDETLHAERAIRAGARGYITKQEATRKILDALETVCRGEIYLSEKVAMSIARQVTGHPRAKPGLMMDRLSDRELQVFELIGKGHSTRDIAAQLHLDMRTIETYRARIKEKLNLRNANDLLQHAIHWGQVGGTE